MLLARIEQYLRLTKTPASRFGREAVRDSKLMQNLREGRVPRASTARRIVAHIEEREKQWRLENLP
jgi:hypothetical protein